MITAVKEYAMSYEFISMLALFTYWIPLMICLTVYLFRFIAAYKRDLENSEKESYSPELTIGIIVWYVAVSIIPAINLFALVFDCGASVFKWIGKTLDIPLVSKKS